MTASVSTVIPCYRCSDTIGQVVDSVAKQTLLPSEVILVDDDSGDNTLDVLLELQRDYGKDWLKVIALDSALGASVARNTGWNCSSYDYIAFLDSDDVWHPEKIAVQYLWMTRHPDIALSGHDSARTQRDSQINFPPIPNTVNTKLVSRNQLLLSNVFSTSCIMLKRNLKERFNPSLRYSEDYLLWLEILLGGNKAAVLDFCGTYYFKALFGESGLSKHLWKVEMSELSHYRRLFRFGYITFFEFHLLSLWSFAKHVRRVLICSGQQMERAIIDSSVG